MKFQIINSREDFLERYVEKYSDKIIECYSEDWEKYTIFCKQMIGDVSIVDELKPLLLNDVLPMPYDLSSKLTDVEKKEYAIWLFKSMLLKSKETELKVGDKIEHHLPIGFRCYINENRRNRLCSNDNMSLEEKIKDFQSLVTICVDKINEKCEPSGFKVEADISSSITPTDDSDKFRYFTLNVKQIRSFNDKENTLINSDQVSDLNNFADHGIIENIPSNIVTSKEDFGAIVTGITVAVYFLWLLFLIIFKNIEKKKFLKFVKECVTNKQIGIINDYFASVKHDFITIKEKYETGAKKIIGKENVMPYFADLFKKYVNKDIMLEATFNSRNDKVEWIKEDIILHSPCVLGFEISASDLYAEDEDGAYSYTESPSINKLRKYVKDFVKNNFNKKEMPTSKSTLICDLSQVNYGDQDNYWVGYVKSRIIVPKHINKVVQEIINKWKELNDK